MGVAAGDILIEVAVAKRRSINTVNKKTSIRIFAPLLLLVCPVEGVGEGAEATAMLTTGVGVIDKAFRRLSLIANAGFFPGAPKLSLFSWAGRIGGFEAAAIAAVMDSGESPCKVITFVNSTSSFERVLEMISMSLSARTHFSWASSCISAYEAVILVGKEEVFGEGPLEGDGELLPDVEEARREWRMYFVESFSISCCNSRNVKSSANAAEFLNFSSHPES